MFVSFTFSRRGSIKFDVFFRDVLSPSIDWSQERREASIVSTARVMWCVHLLSSLLQECAGLLQFIFAILQIRDWRIANECYIFKSYKIKKLVWVEKIHENHGKQLLIYYWIYEKKKAKTSTLSGVKSKDRKCFIR